MALGTDELVTRFRHHPPKLGQPEKYQRSAVLELATILDNECPDSREKTLALDYLDNVLFFMSASIARREQS